MKLFCFHICFHRWVDDGTGYILFDGYGKMFGEQAKIKSELRLCEKCGRSEYRLLWTCGNGRKKDVWYKNEFTPLRSLCHN